MQNTTTPNHIYLNLRNRRHLWFKFSEYSVAKNIKIRSRSNTTKLCAFVPLCLCTFLPIPVNPVKILTVKISVQNYSLLRLTSDFYLNPINLIKILTVKNSVNQCQKFCISLALQVVRPPFAENLPYSLFVRNIQKSSKIFRNRRQKLSEIVRN